MKLKFVTKNKGTDKEQLTLNDVMSEQLFIDNNGWLCQKVCSNQYNTITDENGALYGDTYYITTPEDMKVTHIFEGITRIKISE